MDDRSDLHFQGDQSVVYLGSLGPLGHLFIFISNNEVADVTYVSKVTDGTDVAKVDSALFS